MTYVSTSEKFHVIASILKSNKTTPRADAQGGRCFLGRGFVKRKKNDSLTLKKTHESFVDGNLGRVV